MSKRPRRNHSRSLERFPIRQNRRGFPDRRCSDSRRVLAKEAGAQVIGIGAFITAIINFLIIAFVLFLQAYVAGWIGHAAFDRALQQVSGLSLFGSLPALRLAAAALVPLNLMLPVVSAASSAAANRYNWPLAL